ncbi:MAG: formylglycine-generating enzyme family protein [Planctomycetaceae bacterium]
MGNARAGRGLILWTGFVAAGLIAAVRGADEPNPSPPDEAARAPNRVEVLRRFADEFVPITPGEGKFPKSFVMDSKDGPPSERPPREVMLPHDFAMAKYEVTQELYEAVTGRNPSVWGGPRNSVEMLSFTDAQRFCARATAMLRDAELIGDDEEIRLPSEAEWEYCCRAGSTTAYSFGDEARAANDRGDAASLLDRHAWHTGNAAGNDPPVGALAPNEWGLYDMHGYLWEYVADAWHPDHTGAPADGGARDATKTHVPRVIRGGSWRDRHELLRSATRWPIPDHARSDAIGFRCVKASTKR